MERRTMSNEHQGNSRISRLHRYLDTICGLYSRVARRLGVDRSYVSRVAAGERRSPDVERAILSEFDRISRNPPV